MPTPYFLLPTPYMEETMKKLWFVIMLVLAMVILAGCDKLSPSTPAAATTTPYTSKTLDASYEGALSAAEQLSYGTLQLEGTDQAVTPEQAKTLLPLWQALQGAAVQTGAEEKAVYGQIEAAMTEAQLQAIAAMKLSQQDLGGGMFGPGGAPPAGEAPGGDLSDKQRAAMRATREAGGGAGGPGAAGGQFGTPPDGAVSDEQRAAMRATFEAGGGGVGGTGAWRQRGSNGSPRSVRSGQNSFVLNALIRLLTERAAQGS
jgi:hypothetical protein